MSEKSPLTRPDFTAAYRSGTGESGQRP